MQDTVSEFLGQILTAGGALFSVVYESPISATLSVTFRGPAFLSPSSWGAVGVAGFLVAAIGSFVGIVLGQLRPPDRSKGASLLFWVDFIVILFGDVLFYAVQPPVVIVALLGVVSAFLATAGLLVIVGRPLANLRGAQPR